MFAEKRTSMLLLRAMKYLELWGRPTGRPHDSLHRLFDGCEEFFFAWWPGGSTLCTITAGGYFAANDLVEFPQAHFFHLGGCVTGSTGKLVCLAPAYSAQGVGIGATGSPGRSSMGSSSTPDNAAIRSRPASAT